MSAEQNKAIRCRFLAEAINGADMAAFDELVAEDVVDHFRRRSGVADTAAEHAQAVVCHARLAGADAAVQGPAERCYAGRKEDGELDFDAAPPVPPGTKAYLGFNSDDV